MRNLDRIGNGRWQVSKQGLHLRRGLEILVASELAHPAGVGQDFPLCDADAGLMRLVVIRPGKLNWVGCDDGQAQSCSELCCRNHMGFIVSAASALKFHIKPVRENARQTQRNVRSARLIPLHQRLPYRTGLSARQRD